MSDRSTLNRLNLGVIRRVNKNRIYIYFFPFEDNSVVHFPGLTTEHVTDPLGIQVPGGAADLVASQSEWTGTRMTLGKPKDVWHTSF